MYYLLLLMVAMETSYATNERLGQRGPNLTVFETNEWPATAEFYESFGLVSRPMVVRGGGAKYPASTLWTDEYLLENVDKEIILTVEREKKENRKSNKGEGLTFPEFLDRYQKEEMYMVNALPETLKKDVILPSPLQCHVMEETLSVSLMWFSNGGTSSVLHIDSMDNINCLITGTKHVVLIDRKYADKIPINHDGNYCEVDVDNVDFEIYPGMLDVEYYHVDLNPGDCLFIPYRWFHQIRSQERNIAVNIWWNHYTMKKQDFSKCPNIPIELKTLDKFNFGGMDNIKETGIIRDHLLSMAQHNKQPMTFEDFRRSFFKAPPEEKLQKMFKEMAEEVFVHLDDNYDDEVDYDEISNLEENVWLEITEIVGNFFNELNEYENSVDREELNLKDEL